MRKFQALIGLVAVLGFAGCGGSSGNACQDAVDHLKSCGAPAGSYETTCSTSAQECQAKCVNAASCATRGGKAASGATALMACVAKCS